jgi:hypothetical protein
VRADPQASWLDPDVASDVITSDSPELRPNRNRTSNCPAGMDQWFLLNRRHKRMVREVF